MLILSTLLAQVRNPIISNFGSGWNYVNSGVSTFINIGYLIATIVFVFIFIVGAFQWITSGSDKTKLAEARGKITHAIIGLIILLLIFLITQLVNWILGINIGFLRVPGGDGGCTEWCYEYHRPAQPYGFCSADPYITPPAGCDNYDHDCDFAPVQDCYCCSSSSIGSVVWPTTGVLIPTPSVSSERTVCENAGRNWILFPNSCADFCGVAGCLMVTTYGCDCGPTMCWNGSNCQISITPTPTSTVSVMIISSPTPIPTSTPTNTPRPTNTPTNTPRPTNTPTNTPTSTPRPTNTPTNIPLATPTISTGTGTCGCDLGVVTIDNCISPYISQCTGQYSCSCVIPAAPTATPIPTSGPSLSPSAFCQDTDSGLDPFTFGVVSENTLVPGVTQYHADSCRINTLTEYACGPALNPVSASADCGLYSGAICLRGECCYDYGMGCVNPGDCCSPYVCNAGICQPSSNIILNEGSGKSCTNLCWDSGFRQGAFCRSIGTNTNADNREVYTASCSTTNIYTCDSPILLSSTGVAECNGFSPFWTYCNCVPNAVVATSP